MTDKRCPSCGSCGFPMLSPEDFAGGMPGVAYCSTCGTEAGELKPYDEVLALNAEYLVRHQGLDPAAAGEMARALLASMPAWRGGTQ
jgi:Putative zinc ribbon domain